MDYSIILILFLSLSLVSCDDIIELKEGEFYHGADAHVYHLPIADITAIKSVSIELTCYKGNCDIPSLFTDAELTTKVDTTLSSASRKIVLKTEQLSNNYYFALTCENNCYYKLQSVNDNPTNFVLEKDYANIILLSQGENDKTYTVAKKEPTNSTPVLLIINAVNCIPSVTLGETTYDTSKYIQYQIEDSTVDFTFVMKVKSMDSENDSLTEKCAISVDVIDDDPETNEISVFEGFTNQYKLTKDSERLNFRYHMHIGGLMITVDDMTKGGLTVEVYQTNMKPEPLMARNFHGRKTILFETPSNRLIYVVVKRKSEGENDIPFTILFNSKAGYPAYFNKNTVNYQYMYPKSTMNYYTDIKEGDQGLVNINLKQGGGRICARVVDKDVIEENAKWLHRVNLDMCTEGQVNNYIPLVPLMKKYSKDKCKNGCELYISINNQEEALKDSSFADEIIITYHKSDEKKGIAFPLNEDITGDSTTGFMDDVYYTTTVDVDTSKLLISYKSNFYRMFVNFDKTDMPSPSVYDKKYTENGNYVINADDIGKESFKGVTINIAFQTSFLSDGENEYYFKIVPQYKNAPTIYRASNAKSELCSISKDESCYFLIPINEYENLEYFAISGLIVTQSQKEKTNSEIYVNIESSETINNLLYNSDTINTFLPTKEKCVLSGSQYVVIPKDKFIENTDFYAIVQYKPESEGIYEFAISANMNSNYFFFPYATYPKFLYLKEDEEKNIITYEYKRNDFQGYDAFGDGYYSTLETSFLAIYVNTKVGDYGVLLTQKVKAPVNIKEREYNVLTLDNQLTELSSYYLVEITDEDILSLCKEITIQTKFYNFDYIAHKDTKDTFKVSGTAVDESFLKAFRTHSSFEPIRPFIEGTYSDKENMGILKIEPGKYNPYLLIKIESNSQNVYRSVNFDFVAYLKNEKVPPFSVPQNRFYTNMIKNTDREKYVILKLTKKEATDTFFSVELATTDITGQFDFSIEKMKEVPAFRNDTELIKSSSSQNSYSRIILNVPSADEQDVLVTFFKKKEETSNDETVNVLVKYQTAKDEASFPKYEYDGILVKQNETTLGVEVTADNIIKGKDNVKTINYILRIYNKTKDFNVELVDHLFQNSEAPAYKPIFEETSQLSPDTESFKFTKNGTELANETFFIIFTYFTSNDGTEFKYGFTPKLANITTAFPVDEGFDWWLLGIIFLALLILGIIFAGIFFLVKKEKEKNSIFNPENKTDNLIA